MYHSFFGLTHAPLGKESAELWDNPKLQSLAQQFKWLLQSPGLGVLTAEPGIGKTVAMRQLTSTLNPHQYKYYYIAETDFGRLDFYRNMAIMLGLSSSFRRAQLWRDIKAHITHMMTQKNILPIFIIDEAQNLPADFFKDFPAFLNFVFDSKDYMTVWLLGHPSLLRELNKPANAALASRIQVRCELGPIQDRDDFKKLITHGFEKAGASQQLMADSGLELVRLASKGNPRKANQLILTALRLATDQKINHLPDDIIHQAIELIK
jgi:type II secretory pathway predicted ATPase ExeA